jgi:hypothetical protein
VQIDSLIAQVDRMLDARGVKGPCLSPQNDQAFPSRHGALFSVREVAPSMLSQRKSHPAAAYVKASSFSKAVSVASCGFGFVGFQSNQRRPVNLDALRKTALRRA